MDKAKSAGAKRKKKKWEQKMQTAKKKKTEREKITYISLEMNTAKLETCWISELLELNILGLWKRNENFLTLVLQ